MATEVVRKQHRELETIHPTWPAGPGEHAVTELVSSVTGALSPFGEDIRFPLPIAALRYEHPTARPAR
ncbi:hypothetical protein [Cumulibacter manganitolerans]|uniref:hypothetical protein n=1 Tax=Cumulibacter manganitolerans TaxID=1884992 RepID=UPI0012980460|nr:hypothetical protein [Cumulibacter manganitolerans]